MFIAVGLVLITLVSVLLSLNLAGTSKDVDNQSTYQIIFQHNGILVSALGQSLRESRMQQYWLSESKACLRKSTHLFRELPWQFLGLLSIHDGVTHHEVNLAVSHDTKLSDVPFEKIIERSLLHDTHAH